ncbi:MAG: FAD-dependent oxidoreductase [Calditrichaeota bacterium]|nr:FAD-dependent oxidoreductase [Calditrichota bacterium]MBT7787793.1 FAD-dependent oxidoreductase [Calditrichota bacterium]
MSRRYPAVFREISWYRENVPCMEACPVHTDSGRYVQLIASERYKDAFLVARSPNPLASVCGRICAAPCEDACRRHWIDDPVSIRPLKRFITEKFGAESSNPDTLLSLTKDTSDDGCQRSWHMSQMRDQDKVESSQKVAIIGSGPAGLACAHDLALKGYSVTIFEALEHAGGMLRYGIPEYRLPRGVIDREVSIIEKLGVEIRTNTPLTSEYNLKTLRKEGFEAFFLSVGAMQGRDLNIPGHEKDGVIKAVDFLLNLNRGYKVDLGRKVVVIGGGSVALDAARSAIREIYKPMDEIEATADSVVGQPAMDAARGALRSGAEEVSIISLESFEELPAAQTVQSKEELEQAVEEGINFKYSWGPKEITGDNNVTGLKLISCTRVFDENGRFNPKFDEDSTLNLEADNVILAIGQQSDLSFLSEEDKIELTPYGTLKIDPASLATSSPDVFAGGDVAFGPRIAIEAVANGKTAANSIHQFFSGKATATRLKVTISKTPIDNYRMADSYEKKSRQSPESIDSGKRTGITEIEEVYSEQKALEQAQRCLQCHTDTIYDPELCVLCGRCADVCPEQCLVFVPIEDVDMPEDQKQYAKEQYQLTDNEPLTVLIKDDTACIRCGLCAVRCPTEAITMERFEFEESVV